MNLYIIAIAVLLLLVIILFCNWRFAKSCVKFWNMMYREERRHNDQLFSRLKRLEDKYMLPPRSRDNMQAFVDSLGTPKPKHEQCDGKALAEDPAPYYALDMMAHDKERNNARME